MVERMKRDWVYPVLEDIRNFLREYDMPEMADDIQSLLDRHGDALSQDVEIPMRDTPEAPDTPLGVSDRRRIS